MIKLIKKDPSDLLMVK